MASKKTKITPKKKTTATRSCSVCGKPGHNARTCGRESKK